MTALWHWVERRTAYPRTALYVPAVALAAVVATVIQVFGR